jgi:hypothetical protein
MGAGVAAGPHFPEASLPRLAAGAFPPRNSASGTEAPLPAGSPSGAEAPGGSPVLRGSRRIPAGQLPGEPPPVPQRRPPEGVRPADRDSVRLAPFLRPRRRPKSRPSLAFALRSPGETGSAKARVWQTSKRDVAVLSVRSAGLLPRLPRPLGRGLHLAAACRGGFVSRPRLARRRPERPLRSGCIREPSGRFRPGRPWPHRQSVTLSDSAKARSACG